ncbi:hypothetical protein U9M48_027538 [Paspalum notatum var. saurae]|uniref:Uncharacterized protein n=1 Tax=Paspalum notatum var. saurae TaxID=547442 RepID=A0AAQ3X087_PASNO
MLFASALLDPRAWGSRAATRPALLGWRHRRRSDRLTWMAAPIAERLTWCGSVGRWRHRLSGGGGAGLWWWWQRHTGYKQRRLVAGCSCELAHSWIGWPQGFGFRCTHSNRAPKVMPVSNTDNKCELLDCTMAIIIYYQLEDEWVSYRMVKSSIRHIRASQFVIIVIEQNSAAYI